MMFPGDDYSTTLFLGDLSVHCTERDIRKLFRPFGTIEAIRIKRGSNTKTNLSYGFIKFSNRQSAELAITQINGLMFLGRCIRIGWATGKDSPKLPSDMFDNEVTGPSPSSATNTQHKQSNTNNNNNTGKKETAQIHVSFISKQVEHLISEATLRSLFSNYGEVIDVALKKSQFDKNLRIQNGYGFVHFSLSPDGVRGAIAAVNALHQVTIDRITYDCSISHALADYLVSHGIPLPRGTTHPSLTSNKQQNFRPEKLSTALSVTEDSTAGAIGSNSSVNWPDNLDKIPPTIESNDTSNTRMLNASFPGHSSLMSPEDRFDNLRETATFRSTAPVMSMRGKSIAGPEPYVDDLDRFDQRYISREYDYPSVGGPLSSSRSQSISHNYTSRHSSFAHYPPSASSHVAQRPDVYHHSYPTSATDAAYYRPLELSHRAQTGHNYPYPNAHYLPQNRIYEDYLDQKLSSPSHHSSKYSGVSSSQSHNDHYTSHHRNLTHSHSYAPPPQQAHHHSHSLQPTSTGSNRIVEARMRQQYEQLQNSETLPHYGRPISVSNYLPGHLSDQRSASGYLHNNFEERQDQSNMGRTYEREIEFSSSSLSHAKMQDNNSTPLSSKISLMSFDSDHDLSLSHFSSFTTNTSFPTYGMKTSSSANPTHLDSSSSMDIMIMNENNTKSTLQRTNSLQSSSTSTSVPPANLQPSQSQSTSAASSSYQILAPDGTELASYSPGL